MSALAALVDALWREGVGPDDRAHLVALLAASPARGPAGAAAGALAEPNPDDAAARSELAVFLALVELMAGTPAEPPAAPAPDALARSWALAAAAAVWSAAIARDGARLDRALGELERMLGGVASDDPSAPVVRGWADLAIGEAALAAGERAVARRRFEAVASSRAPVPLRVTATLRNVALLLERTEIDQARVRCRRAAMLAGDVHPLLAQQARIACGLLEYMAGDHRAAELALAAEVGRGEHGVLPRLLLASIQEPERALALLAEGLRDAAARGDAFAYTMCIVAGARRYAALGRDGDALLSLTAAMIQLRPIAPTFADAVEHERGALREAWGEGRHAAAEAAARAMLEAP